VAELPSDNGNPELSDPAEDAKEIAATTDPDPDKDTPVGVTAAGHHRAWDIYREYITGCGGDFGCQYIPLRWGTAHYGYRHIRREHGFGVQTDRRIAATINAQNIRTDPNDPSTEIWEHTFGDTRSDYYCLYRVVVQTKNNKGIITAYVVEAKSGTLGCPKQGR
jgi:hypothetical protein